MQIQQLTRAIGAQISGVRLADMVGDHDLFEALRSAVIQHGVVFLPDQPVPAPVFQALAERFGDILPHPAYPVVDDAPAVQVLESTPEAPSKIELWHSDMSFSATPPSFTLLHGQIIPEVGGDTLWSSAAAVYDALSMPMRRLLEPLRATHDFRFGFQESLAEPGGAQRLADAIAQNPPVSHPLVRTHPESGRKAVYVNPLFTSHIEQLTAVESTQLLAFLYQQHMLPEHIVRLRWAPHTIAIWDNRTVWHKPVNDFFPRPRRLHRVTIRGEAPR